MAVCNDNNIIRPTNNDEVQFVYVLWFMHCNTPLNIVYCGERRQGIDFWHLSPSSIVFCIVFVLYCICKFLPCALLLYIMENVLFLCACSLIRRKRSYVKPTNCKVIACSQHRDQTKKLKELIIGIKEPIFNAIMLAICLSLAAR